MYIVKCIPSQKALIIPAYRSKVTNQNVDSVDIVYQVKNVMGLQWTEILEGVT